MKINNLYSTTDLGLAAALCLFFVLDSLDKSNPQKVVFYFRRVQNLDEILKQYWIGELRVDPIKYFNQIKIIKTRLYE